VPTTRPPPEPPHSAPPTSPVSTVNNFLVAHNNFSSLKPPSALRKPAPRPSSLFKQSCHPSSLSMTIAHPNLGKSAVMAHRYLHRLGWPNLVQHLQHPTDISRTLSTCSHPAIPYLTHLANTGVPAPSHSIPWTIQQKLEAFAHGPHCENT
jgi:hypothetical protein